MLDPKTNLPQDKGDISPIDFLKWLKREQYRVRHYPQYIVLYRVGNTLIRRIRLRNGEIIETRIQAQESEVSNGCTT